jgi:hypothetical protein
MMVVRPNIYTHAEELLVAGYKPKLSRRRDGTDHHCHRLRYGPRHRFRY